MIPEVKSVIGIPMETERVECNQGHVADFYDELEAVVDGIPAAFVFNVDESGCCEWSDRAEAMRVLVPADFPGDRVNVPVDHHSKRSTIV
jgi:hypothetical protein